MFPTRTLWSLVGTGAIIILTACSGDDPARPASPADGDAAVATVRSFLLSFNERDGEGLIDRLSADACENTFGESCDALRSHSEDVFIDQPAIDIRSVGLSQVSEDSATVEVTTRIQSAIHQGRFVLLLVNDAWLIDDFLIDGEAPAPVPKGMPVIDATLNEYNFTVDTTALATGYFALQLHNSGAEEHELSIKRVDVEADLALALDPIATQPPANTHFIPVAGSAIVPPAGDRTLVLAESLPPGHYFIFCELPDQSGTSHLEHGMATEFTVTG